MYNENLISTKVMLDVLAKHEKGKRLEIAKAAADRINNQKSITPVQAKWLLKIAAEYELPVPFDIVDVMERGYLLVQKQASIEVRAIYEEAFPNELFNF